MPSSESVGLILSKTFFGKAVESRCSNLRAIAKRPPPWPLERKQIYLAWARDVVAGLPFKPEGLLAEFERAASDLETVLRENAADVSIG